MSKVQFSYWLVKKRLFLFHSLLLIHPHWCIWSLSKFGSLKTMSSKPYPFYSATFSYYIRKTNDKSSRRSYLKTRYMCMHIRNSNNLSECQRHDELCLIKQLWTLTTGEYGSSWHKMLIEETRPFHWESQKTCTTSSEELNELSREG